MIYKVDKVNGKGICFECFLCSDMILVFYFEMLFILWLKVVYYVGEVWVKLDNFVMSLI